MVAIVTHVAPVVAAQSPNQPKPSTSSTQGDSQPQTDETRDTPERSEPAIVNNVFNSANAEPRAGNNPSDWDQFIENAKTDPIVLLTLVLAILTLVQIGIYRVEIRETRITERAYIDVVLVDEGPFIAPNVAPVIEIWLENLGRTPAELSRVRFGLVDELPSTPPYVGIEPIRVGGFVMPSGRFYISQQLNVISQETFDAIVEGRMPLWLVGYVRYRDRFGQEHQRGFIRRYAPDRQRNRWMLDGIPGYDYERRVTFGERWSERGNH